MILPSIKSFTNMNAVLNTQQGSIVVVHSKIPRSYELEVLTKDRVDFSMNSFEDQNRFVQVYNPIVCLPGR